MKKIIFNDKYGFTQAVLEGRKTQTRRILLPHTVQELRNGNDYQEVIRLYSGYKVGEVVAVAQKYKDITLEMPVKFDPELTKQPGWTNKMFVKADLMPHRIRITNIRIERLQDISDEDVIHEGFSNICFNKNMGNMLSEWYYDLSYYDAFGNSQSLHSTIAKEAYSYLIAKLYGWSLWDSNPYVFVYDFELIK